MTLLYLETNIEMIHKDAVIFDITREPALLVEIKNIRDELSILKRS